MSRLFCLNQYNRKSCELRTIPSKKGGRGVFAGEDIEEGELVCIFPGEEIATWPPRPHLHMSHWQTRQTRDEWAKNRFEDTVLTSDYACNLSVLVYPSNTTYSTDAPVAYKYRWIDPMCIKSSEDRTQTDQAHVTYDNLRSEFARISVNTPTPTPPCRWIEEIETTANDLYQMVCAVDLKEHENVCKGRKYEHRSFYRHRTYLARTKGGKRSRSKRKVRDTIRIFYRDQLYFVAETEVLQANQTKADEIFEQDTLSLLRDVVRTDYAWPPVLTEQQTLLSKQVRCLQLPWAYPHMGAFINEDKTTPNLFFTEPSDWLQKFPLVKDDVDFNQRHALVALTDIKKGTQLTFDYSRDAEYNVSAEELAREHT